MKPLVTSEIYDLAVLALLFGPITVLAITAAIKAGRDAKTDEMMRRGMRKARELGLLPEDLQ